MKIPGADTEVCSQPRIRLSLPPCDAVLFSLELQRCTYIAIQKRKDGKRVDWMAHVSDEQYRKA